MELVVAVQGVGLTDVQRSQELSLRCHEKRQAAWCRREDGQILPGPTAARGTAALFLGARARMLGTQGPCGQTHSDAVHRMRRRVGRHRSNLLNLTAPLGQTPLYPNSAAIPSESSERSDHRNQCTRVGSECAVVGF